MAYKVRVPVMRVLAVCVFASGMCSCAPDFSSDHGVYAGPVIPEAAPRGGDVAATADRDETIDGGADAGDRAQVSDAGLDADRGEDCESDRPSRR